MHAHWPDWVPLAKRANSQILYRAFSQYTYQDQQVIRRYQIQPVDLHEEPIGDSIVIVMKEFTIAGDFSRKGIHR